MIDGLFKYLFLSFFPLSIYLHFIVTVIFDNIIYADNFRTNFTILNSYLENNNKSQASLYLNNNVSLFDQEEIISVSTTPTITVTSYKPLIFLFIVAIFSSIFYKKKKSFLNHKPNFDFLNFFFSFLLIVLLLINQKVVI